MKDIEKKIWACNDIVASSAMSILARKRKRERSESY